MSTFISEAEAGLGYLPPFTVRIDEVGRLTGLSRPTIYRLIEQGKLKRRKVGTCALIDFQSLQEFMASA